MFFGLAEIRPPKRRKKISVILSKEARCFGVFWFGRGPPPKAPKKKYRQLCLRRHVVFVCVFLVWQRGAVTFTKKLVFERKGCILVFAHHYCVLARF